MVFGGHWFFIVSNHLHCWPKLLIWTKGKRINGLSCGQVGFFVKQTSGTAHFHLCNIAKISNIWSQSADEKLVRAFVSKLEYCKSLLSGCSKSSMKSLQWTQKAAVITERD